MPRSNKFNIQVRTFQAKRKKNNPQGLKTRGLGVKIVGQKHIAK